MRRNKIIEKDFWMWYITVKKKEEVIRWVLETPVEYY